MRVVVNSSAKTRVNINNDQIGTVGIKPASYKVAVNSTPLNRVVIENQQRETIRTMGVRPEVPTNYLIGLTDVDASNVDNNETLVYESGSGKFVVRELPIVSGGTF
jgi:hypothetical protein